MPERTKTRRSPSRKKKTKRRSPSGAKTSLRLLKWLTILGAVGTCCAAIAVAVVLVVYAADPALPRIGSIHDYRPKAVTRIHDRNGTVIGELFEERRTVVPYDKIPDLMVKAVVAAEDADFFKHEGLDYWGMLRAFVANMRAGHFVQGGSTITQQVVKTFFLSPERTIRRKVQEVILARRLESELSKEGILYVYLNQIYFGHGRYGVEEASQFYFGKPIAQANIAECALLAGLPQSPERLSPFKHPRRAKKRQTYVLNWMAKLGFISRQVAKRLAAEPIRVVRPQNPAGQDAKEIVDVARRALIERYDEKEFAYLGTRIDTTIDVKLQRAAHQAVVQGLAALDKRQGYDRPLKRKLSARAQERLLKQLKRKQRQFRARHSYNGLIGAVNDKARSFHVNLGAKSVWAKVTRGRYVSQDTALSSRFTAGDLVRVRCVDKDTFVFDPGPQAAMVALDPQSGDVLALVGGYGFSVGSFNRALRAHRQPGSAFKPFVYGAALDTGRYTPATIVDDAPAVFKGYRPRNFDGRFRGPIRLREALTHSINTVAVRLIDDIGTRPVRDLASALGIDSPLGDNVSLALGTSAVLPIELAAAYAGIANGGRRVEPRIISRIHDEPNDSPPQQQVLRPEVAYVLCSMMQSVVEHGTGRRARQLHRPAAGKTGTTNEQKDAWFAGFTPQLVAVVWVGFDEPRSIGRRETGGRAALPIWVQFMQAALRGKPRLPFSQPPGVTVRRIDPATGKLAASTAMDAIDEVFVSGTEPQDQVPEPDEVDPGTLLMDQAIP